MLSLNLPVVCVWFTVSDVNDSPHGREIMNVTRAVDVMKFCQPVIVKQITAGLTVIDR
jgi:hypothetical protein